MSPWNINCHLGDPLTFTCFSLFLWTSKSKRWIRCWLSQCFNPLSACLLFDLLPSAKQRGIKRLPSQAAVNWLVHCIGLTIAIAYMLVQLTSDSFALAQSWCNAWFLYRHSVSFIYFCYTIRPLWRILAKSDSDSLCQWLSSYPWTDSYRQLLSMQNEYCSSGYGIVILWYCCIVIWYCVQVTENSARGL